jgi:beta-carotene 15,15'-dioxygenase
MLTLPSASISDIRDTSIAVLSGAVSTGAVSTGAVSIGAVSIGAVTDGVASRARLERRRHDVAMCVAGATLLLTLAGWAPSSTVAMAIVVIAVVIGMPHGALDIVIGPQMVRPVAFFGMYLTLAAATVVVWLVAPLLSLAIFAVASWFHFARGDADHHRFLGAASSLVGLSTAGCALGLPLAMHSETVTPMLSDLLLHSAPLSSEQIAAVGWMITYPSIVTGLVAGLASIRVRRYVFVSEFAAIVLVAAFVHPLVSFALYFALWHSPRHLIALDVNRQAVKPTVMTTVATLVGGALIWRLMEPSTAVATQVIFVGLAALTSPHLVVTELHRHRTRVPMRQ